MINDDTMMSDVENLDVNLIVTTVKPGEHMKATKKGSVALKSVVGENKIKKLKLYNCLFIPGLQENLISVKRVVAQGKEVHFSTKSVVIQEKSGEVIARGHLLNGLYWLDVHGNQPANNAMFCKNNGLVTWHKRLGHLGQSSMEKLHRNSMIEGFEIKSSEFDSNTLQCYSCLFGKQTRERFKDTEKPRSNRPLELVHYDVCGY